MKTKIILLLFVFGAVAVLAEKEAADETGVSEEGENDEESDDNVTVQLKEVLKLEASPSKLAPQKPPSKGTPKLPPKGKGKGNRLRTIIETLKSEFKNKSRLIFSHMKINITDKKEQSEDSLKFCIKKLKGQEGGKEETEGLFDNNPVNVKDEIDKNKERAFECFENATDEASEIIKQSKDSFDSIFKQRFEEVENQTQISDHCKTQKNRCLKQRLSAAIKTLQSLVDEANTILGNTKEALKKPNEKIDECSKEFHQKLKTSPISSEGCEGSSEVSKKEVNEQEDEVTDDKEKEV